MTFGRSVKCFRSKSLAAGVKRNSFDLNKMSYGSRSEPALNYVLPVASMAWCEVE
jgi:hypothetical protein